MTETVAPVCFNCAYCSEHYPSFIDTCDIDDHVIANVEQEGCEKFCKLEEVENG